MCAEMLLMVIPNATEVPGFHGAAYVYVYVEDTSERGLQSGSDCACEQSCTRCPYNFEPHLELEIADCNRRISAWPSWSLLSTLWR